MLPTMYQAIGMAQQEANLGNIILFYGQGVVSGSANSAAAGLLFLLLLLMINDARESKITTRLQSF